MPYITLMLMMSVCILKYLILNPALFNPKS